MSIEVTLGAKPVANWQLEVSPDATDEQKSRLEKWLGPIAQKSN